MRGTVPLFTLNDTTLETAPPSPARKLLEGACLVRIYPAGLSGSHVALNKDRVVIGRGSTCEVELSDEHSSREHAAIEIRGDKHWVIDLKSMNGTYVNDRRFVSCELNSGDHIRIGHHIFKYLCSDHVEAMYHEAVFQMMTMDGLTQVYNRRYFEDAFGREVLRAQRHARQIGLLILDLDHFKDLNDQYGHLVGDDILAGVCRRIKKRVRTDELFARIGGEEFALVVVEVTKSDLKSVAQSLLDLVSSAPFQVGNIKVPVTVSIGGAHMSGLDPMSMRDLWNLADAKLYEAKRQGRNQVRA